MIATPQPPSLKLPQPVTDLTAQRAGDRVELRWTMPKRATDKVLLVGDQKARICRQLGSGPCVTAGSASFAPQSSAEFTDHLPASLASGPPRPLIYTVEPLNHAGRTAGPSNSAIAAAGSAPAQIANLQARAQANGILLTWAADNANETVRLVRMLVQKPAQKPGAPTPLPTQQTLEFTGPDEGRVLDSNAALDHTYTYTVQRILYLTPPNQGVELASAPSQPVTIDARDVFPPATPAGLEAIADPQARAIDLSWQPDTEPDLAGYTVYRRDAASTGPPIRISPAAEPAPAFHDSTAQPGHTYYYSVSATDRDGNESPRSIEIEESLPQQSTENPE